MPLTTALNATLARARDPYGGKTVEEIEAMGLDPDAYAKYVQEMKDLPWIGYGQAAKAARTKLDVDDQRARYRKFGEEFAGAASDPDVVARAEELYGFRRADVDRTWDDTSRLLARGYSSRGLGDSGYALNSQAQAAQAAMQERQRARSATLSEAVGERQRSLLGQAQIEGMGDQFLAAYLQAQLEAEKENDRGAFDRFLDIAESLFGYGIGLDEDDEDDEG
jgi:hypothetical protein